jgi:hypothetical protein
MMVTQREAEDFYLLSQRRALKRFFPEPEMPSGFYAPLDFATEPGRAALIQVPELEAE